MGGRTAKVIISMCHVVHKEELHAIQRVKQGQKEE